MVDHLITLNELRKIRNGKPLVLEQIEGHEIEIPMLWLFYDSDTSSYILVRRTYDVNKIRSFNHITFDDLHLSSFSEDTANIFTQAIRRIKEGGCCQFQPDKQFIVAECNRKHN